jgi:hypothetical protein
MKKIDWSEDARADVRRIDRKMAMRIFTSIQRFAETGEGDVKELKGQSGELLLAKEARTGAPDKGRQKGSTRAIWRLCKPSRCHHE